MRISRARIYWLTWAGLLLAFATVRIFLAPGFSAPSKHDLGVWYMLAAWFPIMALNFYEGRRLMSYLRGHHHDKWAELTTFAGFGPGHVNGFRSVPWLFSRETLGDPVLANLKSDYRHFIYWVLIVVFTFPIFAIALS